MTLPPYWTGADRARHRPRMRPQELARSGTVLKVIQDVEFLVNRCDEHIDAEFRQFLLDAGCNAAVPAGLTTDQRGPGFFRIRGAAVDLGAFETGEPTAAAGGVRAGPVPRRAGWAASAVRLNLFWAAFYTTEFNAALRRAPRRPSAVSGGGGRWPPTSNTARKARDHLGAGLVRDLPGLGGAGRGGSRVG